MSSGIDVVGAHPCLAPWRSGRVCAVCPRSRDAQFGHTAGITAAPEVMIKVRRQAHLCRSTRSVGDDRLSS
jgi:hypothetical protein